MGRCRVLFSGVLCHLVSPIDEEHVWVPIYALQTKIHARGRVWREMFPLNGEC